MNIFKSIRMWMDNQNQKSGLRRIDETRARFTLDSTSSNIIIRHDNIAIAEFTQDATQKEILQRLEEFRMVAANNLAM